MSTNKMINKYLKSVLIKINKIEPFHHKIVLKVEINDY